MSNKMIYVLIIYLVGVLISGYFVICTLTDKYNAGQIITIGDLLENIMICITSWLYILFILVACLCMSTYIIVNKPLFKKYK